MLHRRASIVTSYSVDLDHILETEFIQYIFLTKKANTKSPYENQLGQNCRISTDEYQHDSSAFIGAATSTFHLLKLFLQVSQLKRSEGNV